jgi:hypothetical protein
MKKVFFVLAIVGIVAFTFVSSSTAGLSPVNDKVVTQGINDTIKKKKRKTKSCCRQVHKCNPVSNCNKKGKTAKCTKHSNPADCDKNCKPNKK